MLCLTDLVSRCQSGLLNTGDDLHLVMNYMFGELESIIVGPETGRTTK